jgi:hypothetical protein
MSDSEELQSSETEDQVDRSESEKEDYEEENEKTPNESDEEEEEEEQQQNSAETEDMTLKTDRYSVSKLSRIRKGDKKKKGPITRLPTREKRSRIFSRRKPSLFNKVHELTVLSGAESLLIMITETGSVCSYGSTGMQRVIQDHELMTKIVDVGCEGKPIEDRRCRSKKIPVEEESPRTTETRKRVGSPEKHKRNESALEDIADTPTKKKKQPQTKKTKSR